MLPTFERWIRQVNGLLKTTYQIEDLEWPPKARVLGLGKTRVISFLIQRTESIQFNLYMWKY